ncbi:MAG: hypothetical protein GY795_25815 [Desulfobacterales bacterium]|nr:hypothetical protein [Desulfobacterales bacterium]
MPDITSDVPNSDESVFPGRLGLFQNIHNLCNVQLFYISLNRRLQQISQITQIFRPYAVRPGQRTADGSTGADSDTGCLRNLWNLP